MADSFWARKLGVSAPPPHQSPVDAVRGATPAAWWQTPAAPPGQAISPQGYPGADSGDFPQTLTYQQLKGMRADQMSQAQMEQLALLELQEQKYNNACPQCQSTNFLPQGTKIGTQKMGTDKCFDCGASSSTLTSSPEPAVGATGGKAGRATKQLNGGAGSYGRHHSQLPPGYLPTR